MGRSRVLSFMSTFGNPPRGAPTSTTNRTTAPTSTVPQQSSPLRDSAPPTTVATGKPERASSRPGSMIFQSAPAEIGRDTLPELLPIFTFLNSHANKLYQEGYFLKLNDLDISGRPNADRSWTECYAQLVGTVLSLWDAAALDAAGQDGEVPPTFINLGDASIKMIEKLPTRNNDVEPLHNVLSISTAGKNRYLLHFNSLHSLTQWTAAIRLAMFENASLQELYTGSLIAGKGKQLNNIRHIMERTKFKYEDWARVRFGAGTAWQRYWCVITPPEDKDYQKQNKSLRKRSAYDKPQVVKGDIKFYETRKTKKAMPIATIKDAYAAYAIYPQSKPLIDQSTLIKIEGKITIHSSPESTTEGFVFVMPEIHPAVSGFEMMLRMLFPVFDIFGLYGRPNRLIADTLDARGLMFAMPKERRYGYLDLMDVAALVCTEGSGSWTEREWRKRLKDYTSKRITSGPPSRTSSRLKGQRNSMQSRAESLRMRDDASIRSNSNEFNRSSDAVFGPPKKSATNPAGRSLAHNYHARSVSDTISFAPSPRKNRPGTSGSRVSTDADTDDDLAPPPPAHLTPVVSVGSQIDTASPDRGSSSEDDKPQPSAATSEVSDALRPMSPPIPVTAPPAFSHQASDKPQHKPTVPDDLRRPKRMSTATMSQMAEINAAGGVTLAGGAAAAGAAAAWKNRENTKSAENNGRGTHGPNLTLQPLGTDTRSVQRPILSPIPSAGLIPEEMAESPPRPTSGKGISRKPLPSAPSSGAVETSTNHQGSLVQSPESTTFPPRFTSLAPNERAGVLKTVGGQGTKDITVGDAKYASTNQSNTVTDMPAIDFGVTHALKPSPALNEKPANVSQPSHSRTPSVPQTPVQATQPRPSSRGTLWQPGTAIGTAQSQGHRRSMTPEEFVQQRSNATSKGSPVYGHSRNQSKSSSHLPLSQQGSGDWTPRKELPPRPHSRGAGATMSGQSSADWTARKDLPPRPQSRGAATVMSTNPDYNSHLSAREQEHVSRMTGTPLVNIQQRPTGSNNGGGLVGAIEAREQEKKNMKEGLSNQMVQHAIAHRQNQQQQAAAQQFQAQQMANMGYGAAYPPGYDGRQNMPGPWPTGQQAGQTQWSSPQAQLYWGGVPPQSQGGPWDQRP